MTILETKYAIRDPETGLYMSGGGRYVVWVPPAWESDGTVRARTFDRRGEAENVLTHAQIHNWHRDAAAGLVRAAIVPLTVTTEFPS